MNREELQQKQAEKSQLIGYTADTYSSKKINEYYVFATTYKDKKLKKKLFSKEEFDELSEQDILKFVQIFNYNFFVLKKNIKLLNISSPPIEIGFISKKYFNIKLKRLSAYRKMNMKRKDTCIWRRDIMV